jgi:acid phosphatase family membrane protein YuiD
MFKTPCFWAPFTAWLVASFTKMLCGFCETHRLDFSYLVRTGGLPSAHSATVAALATAVGVRVGFGTPVFVVALAFAILTMFDASTVRRSAGLQARLLNEMIDELFQEHHLSERKLVELLGHTRLEVFLGMVIGILVGLLVVSVSVILGS